MLSRYQILPLSRAKEHHRASPAELHRSDADYNLLKEWQPGQVSWLIDAVEDAFKSWQIIREEQAAKDLLIAMIPAREKKQGQKDGQKQKSRPILADPNAPASANIPAHGYTREPRTGCAVMLDLK